MKILLGSHHFAPSKGGIETTSDLLAREFVRQGHEVRVVTQTEGNGEFPFAVVRRPGIAELIGQVAWCDVFLQNNISLRTLWPLLLRRRPLFVIHQTWLSDGDGTIGWHHRLKFFALRFARSFAISRAVAAKLPVSSVCVGNPYDEQVFRETAGERALDLVFVGRLVSDKGVDTLLNALALLHDAGVPVRLTIVGDGPERASLLNQVSVLGLSANIEFVGSKDPAEIAPILNRHSILVVPSRLPEPFGVVALEGIACGCVVVGSAAGGLAEAMGPCGLTFPNGDAAALAAILRNLLADPQRVVELRRGAADHLAQFATSRIASLYLGEMAKAI